MTSQNLGSSQASDNNPLGQRTSFPQNYAPEVLCPIARAPLRNELGIGSQPVFFGADLWTAYELSWRNLRGKPQVSVAHILIPCESDFLIESKSLKLYLGSLTSVRFRTE
jgi:7-cyano-7-deazaguanine reductase